MEQDIALERLLTAVEGAPPVESVAVIGDLLAEQLPATRTCFLITDFAGDAMWRLPANGPAASIDNRVELRGTIYDQVIRSQQIHVTDLPGPPEGPGGCRTVAPVTNRGDAIGVFEVITPVRPGDREQRQIRQTAHALAYVITANRRFTDLFEWGQRTLPVSLAAEIQHNLLPAALCCEAGQATVAGALEPASRIAGDTFDYSLDEDTLHVSITDAMGHHVSAALTATLVIGALRNARRARASLADQAQAAHQALRTHGGESTATGLLLQIGLTSGEARLVNAGHPWPLRLRDGEVTEVEPGIDPLFGAPFRQTYHEQHLDLQPGDRLVLFTDGMYERNARGIDLPDIVGTTERLHPREVVRTLTRAVKDVTGGQLQDDATVICLDWHGPGTGRRASTAGADTEQASPGPDEGRPPTS